MNVDVGRIGVWSSTRIWPPEARARAEAASELESLGYQAVWLGGSPDGALRDPEALLAATRTIAVATGIVSVWNSPAAAVASAYHRVSAAHPGRFLLGLGVSHAPAVEAAGHAYRRPYAKLTAFLDELDAAEPPAPREGRVLAALGPRVLALAGERAAGAHPYLVTPEHTRRAREILGSGPLLAPEQKVLLETDAGRARAIARSALAMYLRLPNYVANLRRLGFSPDDISGASDHLVDALVAWGDEQAIADRVAEHHAAGADHVCVHALSSEPVLPRDQWRALAPALA